VLFDTLVAELTPEQLTAVLAHEIGHYRRRHIPRMLAASTAALLLGLWILALLARQPAVFAAFGFASPDPAIVLLLGMLLAGTVSFWISPFTHAWSRRFEFEADAFAAHAMGEPDSLIGALRRLSEKNLSNLTPHPLYSRVYYSHPTLLERETALRTTGR
jgi:STE24 endopeptidase